MKNSALLSMHGYRKNIGQHVSDKNRFANNQTEQVRLNELADTLGRKMPQRVCPISFLFFLSAVSNSAQASDPTTLSRQQRQCPADHSNRYRYHTSLCAISNFAVVFESRLYHAVKAGAEILSRYDPLKFPGADARSHHARSVSWFSPHSAVALPSMANIPTAKPSEETEIEKSEAIDLSCLEKRADHTTGEVLRKIANTLQYPVTEMSRETQVITYYAEHRPCPSSYRAESRRNRFAF